MQKYANLVELEKCCQTHIFLQNFVLIQPRTSPPKIRKILLIFPNLLTLTPNRKGSDIRAEPAGKPGSPPRSPGSPPRALPQARRDGGLREATTPVEALKPGRPPVRAFEPPQPWLKGSIGEGSNHSNFSDRSSVRILSNLN